MKVNEAIFRDYDIRGIVGKDLSVEFALCFGKAYGTFLVGKGEKQVYVGYDVRETSESYSEACIQGLASTGLEVINVGMITTPMLYWARKFFKFNGAVAITASHNPPDYNGFKPCFGIGAMFGQALQQLKDLMISEDFVQGEGKVSSKNIKDEYFADIVSRVKLDRKLRVIVDCANAVGGPYAPEILRKLGVEVTEIFCDVDPRFPNHPPDPVDARAYPAISKLIRDGDYDCGLLFDGDADRLGAVDENGEIIRGDLITALCARRVLEDKPGALIDFELQCSRSATDDVVDHGGKFKLIRVGHSYIEEALVKDRAELAGETSGHIFFADRWYGFDDAIYAACRFLEYIAESKNKVSQLVDSLPKYVATPTTRVHAPDDRKFTIIEEIKKSFSKKTNETDGLKVITIDGVRLEWSDAWAVIRASNTQPQLTMRAEAVNQTRLDQIKKIVEQALAPYAKEGVNVQWGKVH